MTKHTYSVECAYCKNLFFTFDKYKKFCNLSCSTKNKNKTRRELEEKKYLENPNRCLHCSVNLSYDKRGNKFCSKSCGASYNNMNKDYTKFKPGPKKGFKPTKPNAILFTKIKQCIVCNKYHPKTNQTCSTECKKLLLSKIIRQRIHHGWNPNTNRGRQKKSYLEFSFEQWLNENYPEIKYITEHPFKRKDEIKTYFADFYFPELSLIIELDGSQHNATEEYDKNRDQYIIDTYHVKILRISHTEYKSKIKLEYVKKILEPGSGVKPDTSDWKSDM